MGIIIVFSLMIFGFVIFSLEFSSAANVAASVFACKNSCTSLRNGGKFFGGFSNANAKNVCDVFALFFSTRSKKQRREFMRQIVFAKLKPLHPANTHDLGVPIRKKISSVSKFSLPREKAWKFCFFMRCEALQSVALFEFSSGVG